MLRSWSEDGDGALLLVRCREPVDNRGSSRLVLWLREDCAGELAAIPVDWVPVLSPSGPVERLLLCCVGDFVGWLRGPFTIERRELLGPRGFSGAVGETFELVAIHAEALLSGDGVCGMCVTSVVGRMVVWSSGRIFSFSGGAAMVMSIVLPVEGPRLCFIDCPGLLVLSTGCCPFGDPLHLRPAGETVELSSDRLIPSPSTSSGSSTIGENAGPPKVIGGWIEMRTQFCRRWPLRGPLPPFRAEGSGGLRWP